MRWLKNLLLCITLIFAPSAGVLAWVKSPRPMLILDMRNSPLLPKHFRATSDPLPSDINKTGLVDLRIAGGAQFSKLALQKILHRLGTKYLTIIDLRQESHGMLNENAVSWYGLHDAANAGKSPSQIEDDQSKRLVDLELHEVAKVNTVLQKSSNGEIEKVKLIEYLVHKTSTEEELVTSLQLKYKRIFVQDFHAPIDTQVDRYIQIVKTLPKNNWIYIHCRAGVGRTTVFMAMHDMLHNAKKVSFTDILLRQAMLGGKDFTVVPEDNFKHRWAIDRLNFLKKFYQYAHDNQDNFETSWTEWVKSNRKRGFVPRIAI